MINENNDIIDEVEKKNLVEASIVENGLNIPVDEGVELFDDIVDAIVADENVPIFRTFEYDNPKTGETEERGIYVKIVPDNALIQLRRNLKRANRSEYIEQEIVKEYLVDKKGVNFKAEVFESLPAGVVSKIYKVIKDVSNIDDTEERRVLAQGFADSS